MYTMDHVNTAVQLAITYGAQSAIAAVSVPFNEWHDLTSFVSEVGTRIENRVADKTFNNWYDFIDHAAETLLTVTKEDTPETVTDRIFAGFELEEDK